MKGMNHVPDSRKEPKGVGGQDRKIRIRPLGRVSGGEGERGGMSDCVSHHFLCDEKQASGYPNPKGSDASQP